MFPILYRMAARVRWGRATNSSSTRSILWFPEGNPDKNLPAFDRYVEGHQFGWDWFKLTTEIEKRSYLFRMLTEQVSQILNVPSKASTYAVDPVTSEKIAESTDHDPTHVQTYCAGQGYPAMVAAALMGFNLMEAQGLIMESMIPVWSPKEQAWSYLPPIDGDSEFGFPLDEKSNLPHGGFVRWFVDRCMDGKIAMIGGNDNDSEDEQPGIVGPYKKAEILSRAGYRHPGFVREEADHWLVYYKRHPDTRLEGLKLHIPKDAPLDWDQENARKAPALKGSYPELIDVKVTNQCNFGCAYCYQGSTPEGKEAADVWQLLNIIEGLRPLEVAIGGGEPALWKELPRFVARLDDYKIAAAITTRVPWKIPYATCQLLSAIGYSVDRPSAIRLLLKSPVIPIGKITVHLVVGTMPLHAMIEAMRLCAENFIPVLLLGYKTAGFGANVTPRITLEQAIEGMAEAFTAKTYWNGPRLSVDTAFLVEAEQKGLNLGRLGRYEARAAAPREGLTSLYLDGVTMTAAPSSYTQEGIVPIQQALTAFRAGWK